MPTRTAVYIDGFNLYYWLKPTPYRWVDLKALALNAISRKGQEYEIVSIKYFTANVSDTPDDRTKSTRQDSYFRALEASCKELRIYRGQFQRKQKQRPIVNPDGSAGRLVWIWNTEEKGSDVNLAVELVNDAWLDVYDMAVVISNDSDLERALRIVKDMRKTVGVLVRGDAKTVSLKKVATFCRPLSEAGISAALLPRDIPGTAITIPDAWLQKEQRARIR